MRNPFKVDNRIGQFIYRHLLCTQASAQYMLKFWYTINIVLAIFFGIIHQGGVIQLTKYLQENTLDFRHDTNTNIHLITSHLYSLPTAYLFLPSTKVLFTNPDNGQKYTRKRQFFLHEYGSLALDELQQKVKLLLDVNEMRVRESKTVGGGGVGRSTAMQYRYQLYLAIPSSLTEELSIALFNSNHTTVKYQRIKIFYPHLSMEAAPNFLLHRHLTEIRTDAFNLNGNCEFAGELDEQDIGSNSISSALRQIYGIFHQFGLILYRVEVRRKNTFTE